MGTIGTRGGRAIALAVVSAAALAASAVPAGAAPLNLLGCRSDTGFKVVSATSPTPIATCTLDLPQPGRVVLVGSTGTEAGSGTTGYVGFLDLAIDGGAKDAEHTSDLSHAGGVVRVKSSEVQAVRPVTAGSHAFTLTAERSSGDDMLLAAPSLAVIFVPDGSAQVQVCESPNDTVSSTATTFTPIAGCSLDVAAPSHALVLGSAEATLIGAVPEYEARMRLALDGAPVAGSDRLVNVGTAMYDFHESVLAQAVVPVGPGAHSFALGWQRTSDAGTARFNGPSAIAVVVPDAPERTRQRLCASPALGGWETSASLPAEITACSLPPGDGSALVVASATATLAGGGSGGAFRGGFGLGDSAQTSNLHSAFVAPDAGDGTDRTVVTSTLADVASSSPAPRFVVQGSLNGGTGPATFFRPALAALFVAAPDTTAPVVTVAAPPSPSRDGRATVAFAADETGARFECAVDGGGFAACASPLVVGPLPDGPHRLFVRATDIVGNVSAVANAAWSVEVPKGGGGGGAGGGGGPGGGGVVKPLARGTVSVSWKRVRHGRRVTSLKVAKLVKGAKVTLRCAGGAAKGCPFRTVVVEVRRPGSVSLTARMKRRTLRAGARLSIQVDEPGRAGRRVTYVVRSTGAPRRTVATVK
jgi:hypothetical protein